MQKKGDKGDFKGHVLFAAIVVALGGFLFGYNTSVIAGALVFLTDVFHLTIFQQELVVSTVLIGCIIGAFASGFVADAVGRKKTLFMNLVLFFIGILLLSEAKGLGSLLLGRFITGIGIGVASVVVPLYIAEISPPSLRGTFVSFNQLLVTLGILGAYLMSYLYAEEGDWRAMFACAFVPLVLQFIGLFFIPETPSWLIAQGKKKRAEEVLDRLRIPRQLLGELGQEEGGEQKKSWRALFRPAVRKPFLIGIGVSVFQQITGINTVIYYAPRIFEIAGYETAASAIFATFIVGCVNVAFTVVALFFIDRLGRKPLLIAGLIGMAAALAVLAFSFIRPGSELAYAAIGGIMVYVAFFAFSLGPVAWLLIAEIYPLHIRGRAMGVASFANWVSNYIVSLTFLTLIETFGSAATFGVYTVICLLGLWFVCTLVPETKGKTLEQIQQFWKRKRA